jgi:HEAT repeat protein
MKKPLMTIVLIAVAAGIITAVAFTGLDNWTTPVRDEMLDKVAYQGKPLRDWTNNLKSSDVAVRRKAAEGLIDVPSKEGQYAMGALFRAVKDEDNQTRIYAATTLSRLTREVPIPAPVGTMVSPPLIEVLNDPDAKLRRDGATALGLFGPSVGAAVPALTHLAKNDKDEEVRKAAAGALEKIQPASASSETKDKGTKTKTSTDKDAKDGNAKKTASGNYPLAGLA